MNLLPGKIIEPAEVVQKSEKNLIQVTEDGEHRKRKLKKIIVLLAVFRKRDGGDSDLSVDV